MMPSVEERRGSTRIRLAWAAIAGQVIFTVGWLIAGALERGGYSPARHDISDLSAQTANYAWLMLAVSGIAGALTIAFAVFALRPAMAVPGRRQPISAWLVAASVVSLDTFSDAFFRLDCRAADAGCTAEAAKASWTGMVHVQAANVTLLITFVAVFALVRRMRLSVGWRDLAWPTLGYGLVLILTIVTYALTYGSDQQGYLQRAAALIGGAGIVALALRVKRLAHADQGPTADAGKSRRARVGRECS